MKVIIELNENVRLESIEGDKEINIVLYDDSGSYLYGRPVNVDDLKLALRKMTAK